MVLFNNFYTQYLLIFASLLFLTNLSPSFNKTLVIFGRLLVLSIISWFSTKTIRQYMDTKLISTEKRAVLITGCGSGFGNATALKLNEQGFTVYATVLDPESHGAKQLITDSRFEDKTKVIKMDVRNDGEVNAVYELIKRELQLNGEELWAVVNNAGILTVGPIDWGTMETCKNVFDVNTFGTVQVTRAFLQLIRQSKGRIVNIASMAGRFTFPNLSWYSMSKSAVISFSDALRRENKKWGIKVTTIEPMGYKTQLYEQNGGINMFKTNWEQTSDDVKQVYGQEFYEDFRNNSNFFKLLKNAELNKIDGVVDAIVEAIRKPGPQIRYVVCCAFYEKLFSCFHSYLPVQIADWIAQLIESDGLAPAHLIERK